MWQTVSRDKDLSLHDPPGRSEHDNCPWLSPFLCLHACARRTRGLSNRDRSHVVATTCLFRCLLRHWRKGGRDGARDDAVGKAACRSECRECRGRDRAMELVHRHGPCQKVRLVRRDFLPARRLVRRCRVHDADFWRWWAEFGCEVWRELARLESDPFEAVHQGSIGVDCGGVLDEVGQRNGEVEGGDEDDGQSRVDNADWDL